MVEYGGGISKGPAGQVSGGSPTLGHPVDLGAQIGDLISDSVHTISTMPPGMLLVGLVVIVLGLIILRRAF